MTKEELLKKIAGTIDIALDNPEHISKATFELIRDLATEAISEQHQSADASENKITVQPDIHINAPLHHFQEITGIMVYVDDGELLNRIKRELDAFTRSDVPEDIILDLIPVEDLDDDIGQTLVDLFGKDNAELMIGELVMVCLSQPIEAYQS